MCREINQSHGSYGLGILKLNILQIQRMFAFLFNDLYAKLWFSHIDPD